MNIHWATVLKLVETKHHVFLTEGSGNVGFVSVTPLNAQQRG